MNERVKEELITLEYDKKSYTKRFEEAKIELIEIIKKAEPKDIIELERKYCAFDSIKKYAEELNEIEVKLRTINYIIGE
jgi:hypothetical protein